MYINLLPCTVLLFLFLYLAETAIEVQLMYMTVTFLKNVTQISVLLLNLACRLEGLCLFGKFELGNHVI